jgi:hypothetical protein
VGIRDLYVKVITYMMGKQRESTLVDAGNKNGRSKEDIYLVDYSPIINGETNTRKHSCSSSA